MSSLFFVANKRRMSVMFVFAQFNSIQLYCLTLLERSTTMFSCHYPLNCAWLSFPFINWLISSFLGPTLPLIKMYAIKMVLKACLIYKVRHIYNFIELNFSYFYCYTVLLYVKSSSMVVNTTQFSFLMVFAIVEILLPTTNSL